MGKNKEWAESSVDLLCGYACLALQKNPFFHTNDEVLLSIATDREKFALGVWGRFLPNSVIGGRINSRFLY
jgi:hypothetical protein